MARGSQSIYLNLFDEPVAETTATPQPTLRSQKVSCILDYYYYNGRKELLVNGKAVRISYASLLEIVAAAFFLSTFTLHDIIQDNADGMNELKQSYKDMPAKQLQKIMAEKWPQFVW